MALAFYSVTIVYPVIRIWSWYEPIELYQQLIASIGLFVALALPLYVFIGRFVFRMRLSKALMPWYYSSIGCLFLSFPAVLTIEFIRWLPGFPIGYESLSALAGTASLAIYAVLNAQRLQIKRIELPAKRNTQGASIVQLSDVHIGSRSPRYLERIVERVIKLDPTWVVITGDLLDSSDIGLDELSALRRISNRTLLVMGNHERYEGIDQVTSMLQALGIKVLRNEANLVEPFQFVGIDDSESSDFLTNSIQRFKPSIDAFRVLLYHRPHGMWQAAAWGFDLMLSGHTHRGQLFPFQWVVRRFFTLTHGTHRFNQMTLHISTGTGTWGPILRLGSRNEITQVVFV